MRRIMTAPHRQDKGDITAADSLGGLTVVINANGCWEFAGIPTGI